MSFERKPETYIVFFKYISGKNRPAEIYLKVENIIECLAENGYTEVEIKEASIFKAEKANPAWEAIECYFAEAA